MKLIKGTGPGQGRGDFSGEIQVDSSICYDFVVSLRALFNPRTFTRSRRWAAAQLPRLEDPVRQKGKLFFQGFDTALGYGALRIVGRLPDGAGPADLIDALDTMPAAELAAFMLDTGETSGERLDLFDKVLAGDPDSIGRAVDGLPASWAARCRGVLRDPEVARDDLVEVLDAHHRLIYSHHMADAAEAITTSVPEALQLLDLVPAAMAIERLTGGYTLGSDLELRKITLAPSAFIHPFMAARLDEQAAEALILYGVPSDIFAGYDPVPMQGELVSALKAMSDPNRLTILRMLSREALYTTELVQRLRLAQTTVHHHLAQLRTAGLIRQERDRNGMKYSVRTDSATQVIRTLEEWIVGPPE